jgi:MFS family permease
MDNARPTTMLVTRLARLPRVARLTLLLAVLLFAAGLFVAAFQTPPLPTDQAAPLHGDAATYAEIVTRMQSGEAYYDVAHEVLRTNGYGTASVFNWRFPAWPSFLALLPNLGWAQALLGLLGASAILLVASEWRTTLGHLGTAVAALLTAVSLAGLLALESVLFAEVAAGVLILLSFAAYAADWRWLGVAAALLALFVRELAAPAVIVALLYAIRDHRPREVVVLLLGIAAFAVAYALHAGTILTRLGPDDLAYAEGWLQFGGLGFLARAAQFNGLFALGPLWLSALLLPLGLLGALAALPNLRAFLVLVLFVVAFAIIGKPFNTYWGALFTPLMSLCVVWSVPAIRDLLQR